MFFELITRNSRRSRKRERSVFYDASCFCYRILYYTFSFTSGCHAFLKTMESDAVNRLLTMIPVFYVMTLVVLFFWCTLQ